MPVSGSVTTIDIWSSATSRLVSNDVMLYQKAQLHPLHVRGIDRW
jgi:hypothetical protein